MITNYIHNSIIASIIPYILSIFYTGIEGIPFERWYGTKSSIPHFKHYGCIAYVHVLKAKISKCPSRAKWGIFVGYSLGSCGYSVYLPNENIVIESKHNMFDETQLRKSPE